MSISCTPDANLINALCNENHTCKTCISEWIDNALDAGATRVLIDVSKDRVIITDNGHGAVDMAAFATLGSHKHHRGTRLGRYGIGKAVAIWVGGDKSTMSVSSTHGGVTRSITVDWAHMAANNWQIESPTEREAGDSDIGTSIYIRPIVRKFPTGKQWDDLVSEIGYLYSKAIKRGGVQIAFKSPRTKGKEIPVLRWELPPFEDGIVDTQVSVGGKTARVYCGIVREGHPNPRSGLTYSHAFRVIISATQCGCGDHNVSRICGFVDLDNSWPLTKNKNGISAGAEELYAEVERTCHNVLVRADSAGRNLTVRALAEKASERLNALFASHDADSKAVREHKTNATGTVPATGVGGKHRRAKRTQTGSRFPSRLAGRKFSIQFAPIGDERLGDIKGSSIILNTDNPKVKSVQSDSSPGAVDVIASWAKMLIAADSVSSDGPQLSFRIYRTFDKSGNYTQDLSMVLGILEASEPVNTQTQAAG